MQVDGLGRCDSRVSSVQVGGHGEADVSDRTSACSDRRNEDRLEHLAEQQSICSEIGGLGFQPRPGRNNNPASRGRYSIVLLVLVPLALAKRRTVTVAPPEGSCWQDSHKTVNFLPAPEVQRSFPPSIAAPARCIKRTKTQPEYQQPT